MNYVCKLDLLKIKVDVQILQKVNNLKALAMKVLKEIVQNHSISVLLSGDTVTMTPPAMQGKRGRIFLIISVHFFSSSTVLTALLAKQSVHIVHSVAVSTFV